jgi:hypothetical protein
MEKNSIKLILTVEAGKRLPKEVKSQNVASFCISVLTPNYLKKVLNEYLSGEDKAVKIKNIINLGNGITIAEIEDAIESYPVLSKEQIMRYFKAKANAYEITKISGGYITRPYLIELVEVLEEYTGLRMLSKNPAPLAYLEQDGREVTIGDIAEFFSGNKKSEIWKFVEKTQRGLYPSQVNSENEQRLNIKKRLAIFYGCSVDELDEQKTIKEYLDEISLM